MRKKTARAFFNRFSSYPTRLESRSKAGGAGIGQRARRAAVTAGKATALLVKRKRDAALRTEGSVPTVSADERRGEAFAIQKENHSDPGLQRSPDAGDHGIGQHRAISRSTKINDVDLRSVGLLRNCHCADRGFRLS